MKLRFLTICCFLGVLASQTWAAADPELMKLVMPDAQVVSGINVDSIMLTPFGKFFLSQLPPGGDGLNAVIMATGFDPRRDIHEIVMASQGDPQKKTGLVLLRATYDGARILSLLQSEGQKTETYRGVPIVLTGPNLKKMAPSIGVAFLNDSILVAGDIDSVHGAIDRGSAASVLNPALASLIGSLSANQDLWLASIVPISSFASLMGKGNVSGLLQGDMIKGIQQTSAGVKFGETVEINGTLSARTDQDAASLAGVVTFLATMLQSHAETGGHPELNSLAQQVSVKAAANAVKLSVSIPEAQLETLFKVAHHRTIAQR